MITVGTFEAKTKLSELLDRVEGGEEVVVTRRGKPIARLVPAGGKPLVHPNRTTAEELIEIGQRFRGRVKGPFSSADINTILYDEDGLPR